MHSGAMASEVQSHPSLSPPWTGALVVWHETRPQEQLLALARVTQAGVRVSPRPRCGSTHSCGSTPSSSSSAAQPCLCPKVVLGSSGLILTQEPPWKAAAATLSAIVAPLWLPSQEGCEVSDHPLWLLRVLNLWENQLPGLLLDTS